LPSFLLPVPASAAVTQDSVAIAEVDDYYNQSDPNLDWDWHSSIDFEDDSPYPEVRSAVSNADDPDMPAGTFRAWTIGLLWSIIMPGLNQFFNFRYPNIVIGPVSNIHPLLALHTFLALSLSLSLITGFSIYHS
jgi:hypothetical protein